ncbi:zf-HC2 domain-containing protein [Citricoccus sp.]|uniref:zf-HC2 domain-containing protein n=1 Tax=Citricoccus sp. TaxID=1978372 RepID=UPI0028BE2F90|nr:zf-HC2 domain-containing protein [Citricoccus sp.]
MAVFHPRARFDSYVEDALSPAARERISLHLEQCAACRHEVEQRQRILQAASSLSRSPAAASTYPTNSSSPSSQSDPTSPASPWAVPPSPSTWASHSGGSAAGARPAVPPVLEEREGVAGWKVVMGLGAVGLAAAVVLSTAWIAGDPEAVASPEAGENLLLPSASVSSSAEEPDAGAAPVPSGSPDAETGTPGTDTPGTTDDSSGSAVLSPAGVGGPALAPSLPSPSDSAHPAEGEISADVAVAEAMALTPEMITDLRRLGWNVPSLNGLGLRHESTGWTVEEKTAEVMMSLQGEEASLVLHECRSLGEDAGIPGCPLAKGDVRAAAGAGTVAASGETRRLPVGVEMSVLDLGDGTWTATAQTANASYTVDSDLPVDRAERVMTLVVISERSRVQAGEAPDERPGERLARGFERLLPWMDEHEVDAR